mgnify:FL=1
MGAPCLVCKREIRASLDGRLGEETTSIMFAGDATYEPGRYNIHETCTRPEFRKQYLTMAQLEGKEPTPPMIVR